MDLSHTAPASNPSLPTSGPHKFRSCVWGTRKSGTAARELDSEPVSGSSQFRSTNAGAAVECPRRVGRSSRALCVMRHSRSQEWIRGGCEDAIERCSVLAQALEAIAEFGSNERLNLMMGSQKTSGCWAGPRVESWCGVEWSGRNQYGRVEVSLADQALRRLAHFQQTSRQQGCWRTAEQGNGR